MLPPLSPLPLLPLLPPALLALADGTVFHGHSIGAAGSTVGEVVFNTALTGYQEILTDPSYCRQLVTLTYPHIGNYGINAEDVEAGKVQAGGLIFKDLPLRMSNFRAKLTLDAYLQREGTVAIAGIDTRRLTRCLRTTGAQNACITTFATGHAVTAADIAVAIARAKAAPSMAGQDLAQVVSVDRPYAFTETEWVLGTGYGSLGDGGEGGAGSPGPLDKKMPSGLRANTSAAAVRAGTTVTRQPRLASMRRMLRLTPKS